MEFSVKSSESFAYPFPNTTSDFQKLFALPQANIEAVMQANSVLAKGMEAIGKHFVSLIQVECERAAAATKAAMAVKTLQDTIALNTDYAKVSLEHLVANTTTLRELGVKVAQDAAAPITARVAVEAVETPAKPIAVVESRVKPAA
jgi:phasin family protein